VSDGVRERVNDRREERPARSRSRLRVLPWLVGVLALVQYLQWTVVQPADVQGALGFTRGDLDAGRWWTPITAVVVHDSLSLLLLNLYVLVLYGWRLEHLWGSSRHLGLVLASTGAAWAAHLFVGGATPFFGASSSAFAMLVATAVRWGEEPQLLLGGIVVRARWLAVVVGTMVLLTGLESGPSFLAHLIGGWLVGMSAVRILPPSVARAARAAAPAAPAPEPAVPPRARAMATNLAPAPTIDQILDKISAQGIGQLTPEERQLLDEHSRRLRDR
jgi:membrane associated rhomboid family serine protease